MKIGQLGAEAAKAEGEVIANAFNGETFHFPAAGEPYGAVFDVVLAADGTGGGNALVHIHPLANEVFAVQTGRLEVVIAGKSHFASPGEAITIPRGVPHFFANASGGATRATVSFDPPQQHLAFFRNFAMLTQNKPQWFSAKGDPKLLLIALVLDVYPDHLYLAGPPVRVQKLIFALLAKVARWRGYRLAILPDVPREVC